METGWDLDFPPQKKKKKKPRQCVSNLDIEMKNIPRHGECSEPLPSNTLTRFIKLFRCNTLNKHIKCNTKYVNVKPSSTNYI